MTPAAFRLRAGPRWLAALLPAAFALRLAFSSGPAGPAWALAAAGTFSVALVYALGAALHSPGCGLAAAALAAADPALLSAAPDVVLAGEAACLAALGAAFLAGRPARKTALLLAAAAAASVLCWGAARPPSWNLGARAPVEALYLAASGAPAASDVRDVERLASRNVPGWSAMAAEQRRNRLLSESVCLLAAHPFRGLLSLARRAFARADALAGWPWLLLAAAGLASGGAAVRPARAAAGVVLAWLAAGAAFSPDPAASAPALSPALAVIAAGLASFVSPAEPARPPLPLGVFAAGWALALGGLWLPRPAPAANAATAGPLAAYEALSAGRYAEAAESFSRAIVSAPPDRLSKLHSDRGVARSLAGDDEGAVEDLRAAIRLNYYNAEAHASLCAVWTRRGRSREASEACGRAAGVEPREP